VVTADATLKEKVGDPLSSPTLKGKVGDPFSSPWRRRLPLLPALLFAIAVTQRPFLVSIYYSFTNLKDRTPVADPRADESSSGSKTTRRSSTTRSSGKRCGRA